LASLPEPLLYLVERFQRRGVRVAMRCITSDVNVPTLLCVLWERTNDARRHLVQYGCATHPDSHIAARRAITEAAQSRVTAIQGAREDLEAGAIACSDPPEDWFTGGENGIDLGHLSRAVHTDVRDDIAFMLAELTRAGLKEVVAVDLSNPAFGLPVVKMVVPGLELAFHAVDGSGVPLGWRARRYFELKGK
jgi:ribosomal protein S12 methylthiotransferase accessory factor